MLDARPLSCREIFHVLSGIVASIAADDPDGDVGAAPWDAVLDATLASLREWCDPADVQRAIVMLRSVRTSAHAASMAG